MPIRTIAIPAITPKQLSRFESRIERIPFSECWLWAGANKGTGYGMVSLGDHGGRHVKVSAHRLMYSIHFGDIPDGMLVLHSCHNGHLGCVTPWHLKLGTAKDNTADCIAIGRDRSGKKSPTITGSRNHNARLTEELVKQIRAEYKLGITTHRKLARKYGVGKTTIQHALYHDNWQHID